MVKNFKKFIKVKAGEYELEGIGKVKIEPFEIGKYPVTNAWFEEFIEDDGYQKKHLWSKEGRKWLDDTKSEHPRLWDNKKWKRPKSPVIGVSWYEAYAFTRWLTLERKDRYQYRLLTEAEWQAAAAGHERRKYPWGNEWDKNKCNNSGLKLGKTSPVGSFKQGNTPDGIADLSGNVWEWTNSFYDSNKDKIVLRGGSWGNPAVECRCAYRRIKYYPNDLDDHIGFRCARTVTF